MTATSKWEFVVDSPLGPRWGPRLVYKARRITITVRGWLSEDSPGDVDFDVFFTTNWADDGASIDFNRLVLGSVGIQQVLDDGAEGATKLAAVMPKIAESARRVPLPDDTELGRLATAIRQQKRRRTIPDA